MNERKKMKYNIIMFSVVLLGIILLAVNLNITNTVCLTLNTIAAANIENHIIVGIIKVLTIYLSLSYGICSSLFIVYLISTNCVRINENKKFETETRPDINQMLEIYKKEKQEEKTKDNILSKQTYTIEDLKREKEKLESSLNETVEAKEKQKVLD